VHGSSGKVVNGMNEKGELETFPKKKAFLK
jgi:hypothetical protein